MKLLALCLKGVRVVDLTTVVMGPLATRMLADMGADVIWVESPEGDVLRDYEPMRSPKMGAFNMSVSRNKRSVVLDLKTDAGREAMRDLIATADVFVTNIRRKAIERLGFDEDKVRAIRPDIVYCMANGFGSDGRMPTRRLTTTSSRQHRDWHRHSPGTVANRSWCRASWRTKLPAFTSLSLSQRHCSTGREAAKARRLRFPWPRPWPHSISSSISAGRHFGRNTATSVTAAFGRRTGGHAARRMAGSSYCRTALITGIGSSSSPGNPSSSMDERFATGGKRIQHSDELYGLLDDIVKTKTTSEWLDFCAEHSIPASEIVDLEKIGEHPHFAAVGLLQEDEHPSEGAYRYVRDPILVDGEMAPLRHHSPQLGADTEEVMRELGWDEERIRSLMDL